MMHAPVPQPQPLQHVDLARMGQGMIPPLQPRTIIPTVGDADGAGAGVFSFIGGGGQAPPPPPSMPGSMVMRMMPGGAGPPGWRRKGEKGARERRTRRRLAL